MAILTEVGCASSEMVTAEEGHISFRMIGASIPVIRITVNDKHGWFIIDTGASYTIINAEQSKHFGIASSESQYRELDGLGGRMSFESLTCRIRIGGLVIDHPALKSEDLNALFNRISYNEKIRISGILGSDILSRYRFSINYGKRTLSYKVGASVGRLFGVSTTR